MELQLRMKMSMAIAARIEQLMVAAGYTKKQFAEELGRRPSEVTKWLSGQHNFTVATLAKLAAFFDQPIIKVVSDDGQLQEG
ncbi:MAG: helix-turn-helix transcriptional regulator [Muribaculaceae bacterium]|nr:helix-turn-helix transcriptional regulator [Muribaculaceae bacterium]